MAQVLFVMGREQLQVLSRCDYGTPARMLRKVQCSCGVRCGTRLAQPNQHIQVHMTRVVYISAHDV